MHGGEVTVPAVNDWQPMEIAPKDGTSFQAKIPGHGSDNMIAWVWGLVGFDGIVCGGWCFTSEQEPPDSWTDGICWEVNEDGEQSVQPTRWKKLNEARDAAPREVG